MIMYTCVYVYYCSSDIIATPPPTGVQPWGGVARLTRRTAACEISPPPYSLGCVRACVITRCQTTTEIHQAVTTSYLLKQHQKTGNQPPTGRSLGDVVDKMLDGSGAAAAARTWLAQRRAAATAANGRLQSACGVRASAPIPHSWVDFVFSLAKSRRRTRCHRCALLPPFSPHTPSPALALHTH